MLSLLIDFVIRNIIMFVVIIVVSIGDGGASFDDHERVVEWERECGSSSGVIVIIIMVCDKVESCRELFFFVFVRGNL